MRYKMSTTAKKTDGFHVNPETGMEAVCDATVRACPFDKNGTGENHYPDMETAKIHGEATRRRLYGKEDDGLRKFSFVRMFKKQVEQFNEEFNGIPARFFKADLRHKALIISEDITEENIDEILENDKGFARFISPDGLLERMTQATSSPADNNMTEEELLALGKRLGWDLQRINNPRTLRALGKPEGSAVYSGVHEYVDEHGNKKAVSIIVTGQGEKKIGKSFNTYNFRYGSHDGLPRKFRVLEPRTLAGMERIQKKTGLDAADTMLHKEHVWGSDYSPEEKSELIKTVFRLEDAQREGLGFKAQEKYIKNSSGKIATVWEEKKDTDDIRKEMAKTSRLSKIFKKIDLDNDVDPEAFARFEADYVKVSQHLPKFPKGKEPSLHIRKLGKHSSQNFHVHGLFNPAKNAVAIDIHDGGSSSTVHELFHQYDIVTKGNLSLTPEFLSLSKEYSRELRIPPEASGKAEYYSIPTEQFARFAEVYMHSKIGDDTMLLDSKKFEKFDYQPLMNNEGLRRRVFEFFDKHLAME